MVAPGEFVAVTGESGIGKSTLLNLIAGLDRPDAGVVELDGTDLTRLDDDAMTRLRRTAMGFVFQAFHLLPYLSVAENIALPLKLIGAAELDLRERTARMAGDVGLAERLSSMPHELSGGELQRVALARALVHRPKLILADEPTGNLDPENGAKVLALLRERARSQAAAVVLVTHSLQAGAYADRSLHLSATGLALAS
jgi:putative ABC transport system ATP-binding protein